MTAHILHLLDTDPAAGIRATAELMEARAELATPGPWEAHEETDAHLLQGWEIWMPEVGHDGALVEKAADAEHIAAADPEFTRAVAEGLMVAARDIWAHGPLCECGSGCLDCDDDLWQPHARRALATCRAYLNT